MKLSCKSIAGFVLIAVCSSTAYAQQQLTQTVTAANRSCNNTCSVIDAAELNGNPAAIILVTPIGNARGLNPHPIGAYYMYLKKWSVLNLDGTLITEGAKYRVEYFANQGPDRFVYTVPRQVRLSDILYIDREGLNGNPNAQIRVFPTSSPSHGALYNRDDVKVEYDAKAGKWFIANVNGKPVPWESVYNVFLSPGSIATAQPTPAPPNKDNGTVDPGRVRPPSQINPPAANGPTPTPPANNPSSPTVPKEPIGPPQTQTPSSPRVPVIGRWTLRDDLQPSIAPNSDILLFIHGMDSRAEEANDITKQLFALRAAGYQSPAMPTPPPISSAAQDPAMVPILRQLLEKYKGCILEKYETHQDMIARGLNGNLSGLSNTNGLQVRETV